MSTTPSRIRPASPDKPSHLQDKVVLELAFPITVSGVVTTHIDVRRPKYGDRRKIANMNLGNETEREAKLLAMVTGLLVEDIDQLDDVDYYALGEVLQSFSPPDLKK